MPTRAKRVCNYPGCNALTTNSYCSKHRRKDIREISSNVVYNKEWKRLRNAYIHKHPLCAECYKHGIITAAVHVDHIVPFHGLDDPLRLAWNNLQSLCKACHNRKTAIERKHKNYDR